MRRITAGVAAKAAFAACALLAFGWAPRPAAADDAITVIGGSNPAAFYEVLEDVAQFGGLFQAEHLNVTKQYAGSASICGQLVASGKADICTMSIEPVIQGYDKGLRLVAFFSRDPRYDYILGVLDDSPIHSLGDFKGKDIGEINAGSTSEISANDMLSGAGLKKSDYNFIPIGTGSQALAALQSGKVAAASFPSVELGTISVVGHVKFRFFHDPILDSIPNVAFVSRPDVFQSKGDALKRYTRAIVKAALLIRENPRVAAGYFLQGAGIKNTPDALQSETDALMLLQGDLAGADPSNPRIGYLPVNGISLYCKFFQNDGLTKSLVPAGAIVNNDFIAYANDFDKKAWIAQVKKMH
jgi:NitT/TauT family transport system substrate-binding protein